MMAPRHHPPELDAGDQTQRRRIAGVARNGANEHRFARGLRLRRAGGAAHLNEATGGAGVQCSSGGDGRSGGRSSDLSENGVAVHGRINGWVLWSPDDVLSMLKCSVAVIASSGRGGDEA